MKTTLWFAKNYSSKNLKVSKKSYRLSMLIYNEDGSWPFTSHSFTCQISVLLPASGYNSLRNKDTQNLLGTDFHQCSTCSERTILDLRRHSSVHLLLEPANLLISLQTCHNLRRSWLSRRVKKINRLCYARRQPLHEEKKLKFSPLDNLDRIFPLATLAGLITLGIGIIYQSTQYNPGRGNNVNRWIASSAFIPR